MNYYDEIKNKLLDCEVFNRVKDYSKERNRVLTYYEIGRLLNEAGNEYGKDVIGEYSKRLINEVGKKYNKRTLFRMKQFYIVFSEQKVSTLSTQLTWSHYSELISLKDIDEINYYINVSCLNFLSSRELRERIKSDEYKRIDIETRNKLINNEEIKVIDLVKNPVIIHNTKNIEIITEKILHNIIVDDIQRFMAEIGNSFTFVGSEYKIKVGAAYNYIDILLFNIKFNCYVVVELKITELKKEYIGQIQLYMNYIDKNLKEITNDKTIGIIICKKNNEYVIEYSSDPRIIAREYELV